MPSSSLVLMHSQGHSDSTLLRLLFRVSLFPQQIAALRANGCCNMRLLDSMELQVTLHPARLFLFNYTFVCLHVVIDIRKSQIRKCSVLQLCCLRVLP